jgi:hypothetical protein
MSNISKQKLVTLLRFLYPLWAAIGIFSILYVPSKLIAVGDAVTTASNILANESLFRMSIAGTLFTHLIHIVVVLILYNLFKSVDKNQSKLIIILGLIGVPIAMFNEINSLTALILLNNPDQMMFFLELHAVGVIIASIFWGLWLLPQGVLIYKSRYWPKIFSILMILAGFGFLIGSFIQIISPHDSTLISLFEFLTIGETLFMLWVIIRGANLPKTQN